jgi:CBS-domain-containing membrane protein
MKVQEVMTRSTATCLAQDTLNAAARTMWERDCGSLPVVDADGRAIAMITDRDICMAAFTTGKPLHELPVSHAMSKQLVTCRAQEDVGAAAARMTKHGVRRLPVLDAAGALVGLLSLSDLANAAAKEPQRAGGATAESLRVLLGVSAHRAVEEPKVACPPATAANGAKPAVPLVVTLPSPPPAARVPANSDVASTAG